METEKLLERINRICNEADRLRADIMNESKPQKKHRKKDQIQQNDTTDAAIKEFADMGELNQTLTVKQLLEQYGQPSDTEHVESVHKIVTSNGITRQQLEDCLQRIQTANDKEPKNSIQKYTYSCLHKINRS